jgi:predicted nucleic acid-binding protein
VVASNQYYWDACAFLGWLKAEPDKIDECREVLAEADNGKIFLATSALTLTEVVKLRGGQPIGAADAIKVDEFFKRNMIVVYNADRYVAELSRKLVWLYNTLSATDALHLGTALYYKIPVLHTFDNALLDLDGVVEIEPGSERIAISRPSMKQPSLPIQ